jgi:hypothetical protein
MLPKRIEQGDIVDKCLSRHKRFVGYQEFAWLWVGGKVVRVKK